MLRNKMSNLRKFIDIGANLTDPMYQGIYHGSQKHLPDLDKVLERSWNNNISKIIITAGNIEESKKALEIARTDERLFSTVGCHPTRCNEFEENDDPEAYLKSLSDLAAGNKDKIVAIGEIGLDYDRLQFCSKDIQKKYFEMQLSLCTTLKLPMFLHCRNASEDFIRILRKHKDSLTAGVVHSFDGNPEEANSILQMGLYIGINGCSLKTEENLFAVTTIPSDKLMIETDCPWCEIRPTHASAKDIITNFPCIKKEKWQPDKMVKGRNEPCTIVQILEILARIRDEEEEYLCNQIYKNTMKVFFPHEL
ncbi:deoxyribonuclease TATDN1 isoform X1 [Apis mellifera caucasica]|uniref:Deoxyribonuclease TATDN1 n=3 Tax=Apis TaxID=7459 RepID=A0A7M7R5J3_APIME|nr:putative deoxyribonuclease TATDN1 isoform X1 [Apis mellifera]KAG6801316.1 deoxyribonuclease TATDN1 isoform X1 [Apis mellifera caucasica]KAG9431283.1 deoxyribonuclease TATDN1 isoform X1 [Apis mellifera carnica]|eukprot:XP_395304.3 putative deoxyribonuclease TATDN1 isoform X1 [Apis mellifera]